MIARALLATVVAAVAVVAVPAPAGAAGDGRPLPRWHDGPCAPADEVGVTIVVDFRELGGGVNLRCTEREVTDGADALDAAGIAWQGVTRWGRGFVCRIAGKPADDPCIDTPPASAYWSYWIAPRGGAWCYSTKGVLNRRPPPGSVEGWSFSLDRDGGQSPPPGAAPPPLAAGLTPHPLAPSDCDPGGGSVPTTAPTTAPPSTRPPSGGSAVPLPGDPDGPAGPGGPGAPGPTGGPDDPRPAPGGPDAPTTAPGGTTTAPPGAATTADEGSPDEPSSARGDDGTDGRDGSSSEEAALGRDNPTDLGADGTAGGGGVPSSTVAGSVLVVALVVGAALAARRRRGAASPTTDLPNP